MKRELLKLLLLFPAIFIARSSNSQNFSHQTTSQTSICPASAYNSVPNRNRAPYFYFWGSGGTVQMCRVQQQRTANFIKTPFASFNRLRYYFKSLHFKFQHAGAGYVRSCKLILFPFHDFW